MRLQQLRYIIAIAESGSINAVAHSMFISQSSLSVAVRDLEREMGIRIFNRSTHGISLTSDGVEFLSYARQVVEQADLLESRYASGEPTGGRPSVSSQHYAFAVQSFIDFVARHDATGVQFTLRETRTSNIIADVGGFRSDLGILYLSTSNERPLKGRLREAGLTFTSLFRSRMCSCVRSTPSRNATTSKSRTSDPSRAIPLSRAWKVRCTSPRSRCPPSPMTARLW